ncbi:hypothetical protein N0V90_005105 [Kalmusia sp. IMI 367209]|nr:hypothetical protein N0V90_005105 [Kalmusia sp. IMI 367209]
MNLLLIFVSCTVVVAISAPTQISTTYARQNAKASCSEARFQRATSSAKFPPVSSFKTKRAIYAAAPSSTSGPTPDTTPIATPTFNFIADALSTNTAANMNGYLPSTDRPADQIDTLKNSWGIASTDHVQAVRFQGLCAQPAVTPFCASLATHIATCSYPNWTDTCTEQESRDLLKQSLCGAGEERCADEEGV